MNPKTASKIMSEVPEMKEFVSFIKKQVRELDKNSDITQDKPEEIAIEVRGRQRAVETLIKILSPLVNVQDIRGGAENEYAVE